jgi:hypothetical protein
MHACRDEFVAILILAPPDIGLRCHHTERIIGLLVAAVIGFTAPDRQHDAGRHVEALLDPGKRVVILLHQPLPFFGQPRDARFLEIIRRHLHELGLRRRAGGRAPRQDQIRQFVIRLETARLAVERRARHPGGLRLRPQRGDELGEAGVGGEGCR